MRSAYFKILALFTFILFFILPNTIKAQLIDNMGIKGGIGLSNQKWVFTENIDYHIRFQNRIGICTSIYTQSDLSRYFSIYSAIGYLQNGLKNDLEITDIHGYKIPKDGNQVIIHNLILDLALKTNVPINNFSLYFLFGTRLDYQLGYNTFNVDYYGNVVPWNKSILDELNKFYIDGIIGMGLAFKNSVSISIEYNSNLSHIYFKDNLHIIENYVGISSSFTLFDFTR